MSSLLTAASPLWMMSERPSVLAADLALCHPPLAAAEVRAVARAMDDPETFRLTVVAADRAGLLADTAAALADEGLTVLSASAATWAERDIALHSLTVRSNTATPPDWDALGRALRSAVGGSRPAMRYAPTGRASVVTADGGDDRTLVKVTAPDGLGLLETISRWFAERDISIVAAEITTDGGTARDRFLIDGELDAGCARPPPQPTVDLAVEARPPAGRLPLHPVTTCNSRRARS